MSKNYNQRNAKVDENQKDIVTALRRIGCYIVHTHTIKNAFDVIIFFQGRSYHTEIKNGSKLPKYYHGLSDQDKRLKLESMLSEGELKCMEDMQATGVKYHIVSSIEEAINLVTEKQN